MADAWATLTNVCSIFTIAGTLFGGMCAVGQTQSWAQNMSSKAYINQARALIRSIEEFNEKIKPHERDKITLGQPRFFPKLESMLFKANELINVFEEEASSAAFWQYYGPSMMSTLNKNLKSLVRNLSFAYTDLLTTTNRVRGFSPAECTEIPEWPPADPNKTPRLNMINSIPRLPTIVPMTPMLTGESLELPMMFPSTQTSSDTLHGDQVHVAEPLRRELPNRHRSAIGSMA